MFQQVHFWCLPKENETVYKGAGTTLLTQRDLQQPRYRSNLSSHQQANE